MKKLMLSIFLISLIYASQGERLYMKHGCYGCHGVGGVGTNDFPKLQGKSKSYLVSRLKGYKNETINSGRADMMKPFAKALSDEEIEAIANYLANESKKQENYDEEYDLSDPM
jgi:cytochrome c